MGTITLDNLAERLTAVMPIMCKSMVRYEENALTEGTLTLPQFWALSWLKENTTATMNELAEATNLIPSTATMLVDRLCELKLVERQRDEGDRRKVQVRLTEAGKKTIQEIHDQKKKALRETFRHLNADEREQYLKLIETLAERLRNS